MAITEGFGPLGLSELWPNLLDRNRRNGNYETMGKGFRWAYASGLGWDGGEDTHGVAQGSVGLEANERRGIVPLDRVRANDSLRMKPVPSRGDPFLAAVLRRHADPRNQNELTGTRSGHER